MSTALSSLPHSKLSNLLPRRGPGRREIEARPLLQAIRSLTLLQWMLFFSGWLAWMCDVLDFVSVSLNIVRLTVEFDKPVKAITTTITLSLLLRSVGALFIGIISDDFGRKWPLVVNLLFIAAFELGSVLAETFEQFLVLRSMLGLAMGGIWGIASSTAMENLPIEVHGLASGVIAQGFGVGHIIAAVLSIFLVPETKHGWKFLFYTTSGISLSAAIFRATLPESRAFLVIKEAKAPGSMKRKFWIWEMKDMLKKHWLIFIYAVLLLTGFNFLSHGSQDLYPTFLQTSKGMSSHQTLVTSIIGACGGMLGGLFAGTISQQIGRRVTIVFFLLFSGSFIPLWILPDSFGALAAGVFCYQFGVGGAWGIVPIQLAEISPPASRATFSGVTYQIGSMVSSASAQIEAVGGEHLTKIRFQDGQPVEVPDYGTIQGIFIGVVVTFLVIITCLGPERHGLNFDKQDTVIREPVDPLVSETAPPIPVSEEKHVKQDDTKDPEVGSRF